MEELSFKVDESQNRVAQLKNSMSSLDKLLSADFKRIATRISEVEDKGFTQVQKSLNESTQLLAPHAINLVTPDKNGARVMSPLLPNISN